MDSSVISVDIGRGYAVSVDSDIWESKLRGLKWRASVHKRAGKVYCITGSRGESMHRVIMDAPKGMVVDHIDGDGLNNTRGNLRVCTNAQNLSNTRGPRTRTHWTKGVFVTTTGRWGATIVHNRNHYHLGVFEHQTRAAQAYDRAAIVLKGEFAGLNYPEKRDQYRIGKRFVDYLRKKHGEEIQWPPIAAQTRIERATGADRPATPTPRPIPR